MFDDKIRDARLSGQFADEILDGRYLWANGMGWLKWTGKQWEDVHVSKVREEARKWVLAHCRMAAENYGKALATENRASIAQAKNSLDDWNVYQAISRISALVSLAQGIVGCDPDDFDADPDLLNCQNGIVDLRTGELSEHDPSRMMTKITAVDYRRGATHPDWAAAIGAVPDDVLDWFQSRMGQAITGYLVTDDRILIMQGGGANGKGTVMEAALATIGDYGLKVSPRALSGNLDSIPTELADFKGARIAWLDELPEKDQLAITRVKQLAGSNTLTARRMRQDSFTFETTHSLIISTNYPPAIVETDTGTWRRFWLMHWPFYYVLHPEDIKSENDKLGDLLLRERLRRDVAAREACLAWLVEGAVRYYQDLEFFERAPKRIEDDTREWRMNSDLILGYASECLMFDRNSVVLSSELLEDFNNWLMFQQSAGMVV
jgi:putative DNA primase/helicase